MNFNKGSYLNSMHLVLPSPWPFCASISAFGLVMGNVFWWHNFEFNFLFFSISFLLMTSILWWCDVSFENEQGFHNSMILESLRLSMMLFILSEVLFFFSFFWGYFHNCWSPSSEMGFSWPPFQFSGMVIDPFSMPLLNTIMLLSSGASITFSHHSLLNLNYNYGVYSLGLTIFFGVFFLYLQLMEYSASLLSINSTIYGSSFFLLTGFHGLHVTIGSMFLMVSFFRFKNYFFSKKSHVSFELCAWYWHFVDVVWLFLYFFVYWYGYFCLL